MYLSFIFILTLCQVQFNLANNIVGVGAGTNDSIKGLYSADIAANDTLLDIQSHVIGEIWDIDTWPEKRHYMKYWNYSSEIDETYLNSTSEIDLSLFEGVEGIWVFPHSRRFGAEFFAYFTRIRSYNFYQKLEIFFYLHGQAELRYFNNREAVDPSQVFRGNGTGSPGWQSVEFNTTDDDNFGTLTFRLEFHTHENGDFAFLDKIIGYHNIYPTPTSMPRANKQ